MSGLEPHSPDEDHEDARGSTIERAQARSTVTAKISSNRFGRWRRTVGLLLLGLIIFLWTATNFLASAMMADHSYSKAYFLTYCNTSFFILPMIPVLVTKGLRHPEELRQFRADLMTWLRRRQHQAKHRQSDCDLHEGSAQSRTRLHRSSASQELLLGDPELPSAAANTKALHLRTVTATQFTLFETAQLSFEFCFLWFLANYFVVACLEYTTVASATILTSLSGVFTLIFGSVFGVERFTVRKLLGVLASIAGIVLISSVDLTGNSSDDDHRGDFPKKSLREITIGNALAFMSAVMYGLYSVFMKKRIADESAVNMPIFFGFVGLTNVLVLWPGILLLHWTGVEIFELPSHGRITLILVSNAVGSMISDLAWAYAVLLTSPIVVTVGLSMTIPLSLIGQMVVNSQTSSALYWVGAIIVVLSFVFVNHEEKKDEVAVSQHETPGLTRDNSRTR